MRRELKSDSAKKTKAFAACLASELNGKQAIICLYGDLGAGKTTFVKGFGKALGINEKNIKSPTFVLMNTYRAKAINLHHLDCYRIGQPEELLGNLLELIRRKDGPILIEWAERLGKFIPKKRVDIRFHHVSPQERMITVYGN